jgi:hypothetical protein
MLDYLADGSVFIDAKPWVFCGLVDRLRRQPHALQRPPKGVDTADWATELAYWGYEGGVATTKKRKASDEASDGDEEEEEEEAEGEAEDDSDDEEETVKGTMHDQWARKIVNALRKLLDDAGLLENAAITGDDITLESFPGTTWDVDGKKVDLFQWLYNSSGRYKDLIRRTLGCANLWAHQKMLERSKRANLMEPVGWPANTLMSHRNINQDATYSVSIKFSL